MKLFFCYFFLYLSAHGVMWHMNKKRSQKSTLIQISTSNEFVIEVYLAVTSDRARAPFRLPSILYFLL